MKCWYCKTELGDPWFHGRPAPVVLRCKKCINEVEYKFDQDSEVYEVLYGCSYHGQVYMVCIKPKEEIKFFIYRTESNLWFAAVRTKTIPNVSPANIRQKIATYLVFS